MARDDHRDTRPRGTDLILRDLKTGTELNVGNVSEWNFNKSGRYLALVIDAADQAGNGIQIGSRCQILNNNCSGNIFAGISVLGSGSRIDSNHATGGQRGLHVIGSDNLIVRNSVQGATVLSYDTAVGNHQAALITSPGLGFASTSPWANCSF